MTDGSSIGRRFSALTELLRRIEPWETDIPVISTDAHRDYGRIIIEGENIDYAYKETGWFRNCTRGAGQNTGGTEAKRHEGGALVFQNAPDEVVTSKASAQIATRHNLNFLDGAGIAVQVADNPSADQTDVTVGLYDESVSLASTLATLAGVGQRVVEVGSGGGLIAVNPLTHVLITSNNAVSASSAVNLDNVFSATFLNYELFVWGVLSTVATALFLRMRLAGVNAAGATDYRLNNLRILETAAQTIHGGTASAYWLTYAIAGGTVQNENIRVTIMRPNIAIPTGVIGHGTGVLLGVAWESYLIMSTHVLANAYDGCCILPSGGTWTGGYALYGIKI